MATANNGGANGCKFHWRIENVSNCWWLKKGNRIDSPKFVADALLGTKWSLWLYPMGKQDENYIHIYLCRAKDCSGPDVIEVFFNFSFLGKDGSLLQELNAYKHSFSKGGITGFTNFERCKRFFIKERETFLEEDTLTVQCTVWMPDQILLKSKHFYGLTVLKVNRKSVIWKIDKFSTLKTVLRKKLNDTLFDFDLVLNEDFGKNLDVDIIALDGTIKYISFNVSVIDSEEKKENCGYKNYLTSDLKKKELLPIQILPVKLKENRTRYWPNDVLSLDIEFAFATVEHFDSENYSKLENNVVEKNEDESLNTAGLNNDLKSLYNEGIFSDMELRTSTKSFPVHKNILSSRSPVFRRMFSNEMKEVNTGHVIVSDFEDDTVHRMLLFIYTDALEDLQFENGTDLYKIADKYDILLLKNRCCSFLKDNLCPKTVCDVLSLAELHFDDNLKNAAVLYILEHEEVFSSLEFEHFMNSNLKLAADIMYKKVNRGKINKDNM